MCDILDDEKKEHLIKEDNKIKKEKCDNLNDNEQEQSRKYFIFLMVKCVVWLIPAYAQHQLSD